MIIRATKVCFLEGVVLEMTYQDGKIVRYDMSKMFSKYPQLKELETNRQLFESGYIDPGGYGVIWNDDLDFDAMSIYEDGEVVGQEDLLLFASYPTPAALFLHLSAMIAPSSPAFSAIWRMGSSRALRTIL